MLTTLLFALTLTATASEPVIAFPDDARVVDVSKPPYEAVGDGRTDVTAILQRVIDENSGRNAIIYLPKGTWLISDTLRWPGKERSNSQKRTILQGAGRRHTILRFPDGLAAAADAAKPLALVWTGEVPAQRFRNAVRDLTLDVGADNPGAIGLRFYANNQGGVRQVRIRAPKDSGHIGLDLGYSGDNGPLLLQDVEVDGFAIGINARGGQSITGHRLHLHGQRRQAVVGDNQHLLLQDVSLDGPWPLVRNGTCLVLLDAQLAGGSDGSAALATPGTAALRQVSAPTGRTIVGTQKVGTEKAERTPLEAWFGDRRHATPEAVEVVLERRDAPKIPWEPASRWASPLAHGGIPGDQEDDTAAIQAAIDSGATTIYLPNGRWVIDGTVEIRGAVRRFIGCEASIAGAGTIRIGAGDHPVIVERLDLIYSFVAIEGERKGPIVLSAITSGHTHGHGGKGRPWRFANSELYGEDVCVGHIILDNCRTWLRQFNPENGEEPGIQVRGGKLWLLGLKTEGENTKVHASAGAQCEVYAYILANKADNTRHPLFVVEDAQLSATVYQAILRKSPFSVMLRETRAGTVHELRGFQHASRIIAGIAPTN